MSIYATLWSLKLPVDDCDPRRGEWIEIVAQGVPGHIGTPTPGHGYEDGDPYADFLPPAIEVPLDDAGMGLRAVVFVEAGSVKGTPRCGQEYVAPLLVLSGDEYARISFVDLHARLRAAIMARRPAGIARLS